ncbi:heme NO-binding domain-containing protein [Rhizobium halophytocola]|uniref:Heme NO-binding domain-containing protein n=1 Tax=Rhizobium halophytocola TaxID=735519 RepID=A0ABS4E425_9HYPH|nr:heme NO-binding domain-containing protein [Rhizobium halophytocola]MBP1852668.1 hypothetical protein [Rhizobium halophytocola]
MKGIVFTEFLEFVAETFNEDLVDDMIEDCDFAHKGAYTAVGSYAHEELVKLGRSLSRRRDMSVAEIMCGFGRHLGHRFAALYPVFFDQQDDFFAFLDGVEHNIHGEVKKLYPDAELPSFRTVTMDGRRMVLEYRSSRHLQSLAEGLILGTGDMFGETITVAWQAGAMAGEPVVFSVERCA